MSDEGYLSHGIDLSKVQDLEHNHGMDLPTATDESGKPLFTGMYSGPYFDFQQMNAARGLDGIQGKTNITAQVGTSVVMPCVVKQVGKNTVSDRFLYELFYLTLEP